MKSIIKTILLISSLVKLIFTNIIIPGNPNQIEFQLLEVGTIPYGKTISQNLITATPTPDNCTLQYNQQNQNEISPSITLIQLQNDCKYWDLVLQAQKKGSQAVIIFNNNLQEALEQQPLLDQTNQNKITIPTLIISPDKGTYLQNLVKSSLRVQKVSIQFEQSEEYYQKKEQNDKKLDIKFVLNQYFYRNEQLLDPFMAKIDPLKDKINFTPIQHIYDCKTCEDNGERCLRKGRYCAMNVYGTIQMAPKMMKKYLQQLCVNKHYGIELWYETYQLQKEQLKKKPPTFNFLHQFRGNEAVYPPQVNTTVIKECVLEKEQEQLDQDLDILEEQVQFLQNITYKKAEFPSVYINDIKYEGKLEGLNVAMTICKVLQDPYLDCKKLFTPEKPKEKEILYKKIDVEIYEKGLVNFYQNFVCDRILKEQNSTTYIKNLNITLLGDQEEDKKLSDVTKIIKTIQKLPFLENLYLNLTNENKIENLDFLDDLKLQSLKTFNLSASKNKINEAVLLLLNKFPENLEEIETDLSNNSIKEVYWYLYGPTKKNVERISISLENNLVNLKKSDESFLQEILKIPNLKFFSLNLKNCSEIQPKTLENFEKRIKNKFNIEPLILKDNN